MKKTWILALGCVLFLLSCQDVQRTYTKDVNGVTIRESISDGTSSTKTYADPSIKFLKNQGLEEREAVELIAKGTPASSSSTELTTAGWIIVIVIIVIMVILAIATGDGFFAGWAIAEAFDSD
jgi:hypothetical protein